MERKGRTSSRGGFALPATVGLLTLLGIVAVGTVVVVQQEMTAGKSEEMVTAAAFESEMGMSAVMTRWWDEGLSDSKEGLGSFQSEMLDPADLGMEGEDWMVELTRLSPNTFFLRSMGYAGSAMKETGYLMKEEVFTYFTKNPIAVLTSGTTAVVSGNPTVNGYDHVPAGWGDFCPAVEDAEGNALEEPLLAVAYGTALGINGTASELVGDIPAGADGSHHQLDASSELVNIFPANGVSSGISAWDQVLDLAADTGLEMVSIEVGNSGITPAISMTTTIVCPENYAPGTGGNSDRCRKESGPGPTWADPISSTVICDAQDELNWGDPSDPTAACGNHFPIVHLTRASGPGNSVIQISGGTGQGVLLVDGDLRITGPFSFHGLILVRGNLRITGGGSGLTHHGRVIATGGVETQGNTSFLYSSCAIKRATGSLVTELRGRSEVTDTRTRTLWRGVTSTGP